MNKLPKILAGVVWVYLSFFFSEDAYAVTIATQDQIFSNQLSVWQAIQELGSNLSGVAEKFTFRVSTSRTNLNQFDHPAENSRIYDKSNNNPPIVGCVPNSSNPNDRLRGLTFNTTGVPAGYEDVTIDFSCTNYSFIPGHKYLIRISNANIGNSGSGTILFGTSSYSGTNLDYFPDGGLRYAFNNNSCDAAKYVWNSPTANNGCNVFNTPKEDLYFILTNTTPPPPPPKLPVIFIPGIGGSELKASQQIFWEQPDGHGSTYKHGYEANEKIWVNQDKAVELGEDDYFDVLKLKSDGVTSEADLALTGNLTSFGYGDIDSFFTGMGYVKGTNFFIFPYDWRKDVRTNKDSLDNLIEQAKTASGQPKVNLVVHSMGGLIARFYISDSQKAAKVNKLIELGVPHLGAVSGLKALIYGEPVGRWYFKLINIGINGNEVKDVIQNFPSQHSLIPSAKYFDFYNNSNSDFPYPIRDDQDIDSNKVTADLNYDQTKSLLSNLNYNMTVFGLGEQFHTTMDPLLNQTNGTKVYEIVGTAQPTLGQIHETWWITWPINLIPKTDEIYINGDDTVPLYSASLKSNSLDLTAGATLYYVEQKHSDLVSGSGSAMLVVKNILNDDNSLPVEVKSIKIDLEGQQLSLDDGELDLYDDQNRHCGLNDKGEIEENIPDVTCTTSGNTKHAFVKKKSAKVRVTATRKKPATSSKITNLKTRTYKQDKISKTTLYKDILIPQIGKIEFILDPSLDTTPILTSYPDATKTDNTNINSTSETTGSSALDQTPPTTVIQISGNKDSSGIYTGPVTITLTGNDANSGILRIEYSLDTGMTVQTYSGPFTISTSGKTTIQFKSIDKSGNEEIPQTITIEIAPAPTPTPTPTPTPISATNSSTSGSTSTTITNVIPSVNEQFHDSISSSPGILGVNFENPSHISDEINVSHVLDELKNPPAVNHTENSVKQILGGLLIASGGVVTLAAVGLLTTFASPHASLLKPFPK